MAEVSILDEIELVIEEISHGGGGTPPPTSTGRDGGEGGSGGQRPAAADSPSRKYAFAVAFLLISILVLFLALAVAFGILRTQSKFWIPFHMPRIVLVNTAILLASSVLLEVARRKLRAGNPDAFKKIWMTATGLGVLFVLGQLVAWRELAAQGVYMASSQASSFFYVFTGVHAVHLLGGIGMLLFVALRKFGTDSLAKSASARVASLYWHVMDVVWLFLLGLLLVA